EARLLASQDADRQGDLDVGEVAEKRAGCRPDERQDRQDSPAQAGLDAIFQAAQRADLDSRVHLRDVATERGLNAAAVLAAWLGYQQPHASKVVEVDRGPLGERMAFGQQQGEALVEEALEDQPIDVRRRAQTHIQLAGQHTPRYARCAADFDAKLDARPLLDEAHQRRHQQDVGGRLDRADVYLAAQTEIGRASWRATERSP